MATLSAGSVATLYLPGAQTITFTPGTSGRISINGRNVDGSAVTPQEIYTATSVAFRAGATVTVEAINVDCTYTDVEDSSLSAAAAAWAESSMSGAGKVSTALAMLIPSSGSVAANGALTLTTAIPLSGGYSWGCYMYLPAGAAYAASVAGLYYVEMSANNAGTIYDNRYTSGSPTIPTTKTPIVAAGPGAYTQTTSPVDLITVTLPANTLGANGRVLHQPAWVFPNNANNKVISTTFGGSNIYAKTRTTATQETPLIDIRNRGVTNRQFSAWGNTGLPATASTAGVTNTSIDTTAAVSIVTRGQLAVATDYIILESCSVEYVPF